MIEWILITTIHLNGVSGNINNFDVETIDGFTSEATCLEVAEKIGTQIGRQPINHEAAEGMDIAASKSATVFTSCIEVIK